MPIQPAQALNSSSDHTWKIAAVAGVLFLGGVFGAVVAVTAFGGRGGEESPAGNTDSKSAYQQAFDASFKNSCRQSAMRSGNVSRASAENYCDCALPVFNQTHDMAKVIASCKKYAMR